MTDLNNYIILLTLQISEKTNKSNLKKSEGVIFMNSILMKKIKDVTTEDIKKAVVIFIGKQKRHMYSHCSSEKEIQTMDQLEGMKMIIEAMGLNPDTMERLFDKELIKAI